MFSVLIPTFYAWSVHGIWTGLLVFLLMHAVVLALNYRYFRWLEQVSDETLEAEMDPEDPCKWLVRRRILLAILACLIIAISSMHTCYLIKGAEKPVCQSLWSSTP